MRKATAIAAASLTTLGTIGSIAAVPTVTASETQQQAAGVLRYNDLTTQYKQYGQNRFIASGINRRAGQVVGYSNLHGRRAGNVWTIWSTFTLRGGIIYVAFESQGNGTYDGVVTGGTGAYEDATGEAIAAANLEAMSAKR